MRLEGRGAEPCPSGQGGDGDGGAGNGGGRRCRMSGASPGAYSAARRPLFSVRARAARPACPRRGGRRADPWLRGERAGGGTAHTRLRRRGTRPAGCGARAQHPLRQDTGRPAARASSRRTWRSTARATGEVPDARRGVGVVPGGDRHGKSVRFQRAIFARRRVQYPDRRRAARRARNQDQLHLCCRISTVGHADALAQSRSPCERPAPLREVRPADTTSSSLTLETPPLR